MCKAALLFTAVLVAFAAGEDPWTKLRGLSSGTELRIYTTGSKKAVSAKLYSVSEQALIVVSKRAQTAIAKDQVERVDARAEGAGTVTSIEAQRTVGTKEEGMLGRSKDTTLPPRSAAGTVRIRPKPGFETVYLKSAKTGE